MKQFQLFLASMLVIALFSCGEPASQTNEIEDKVVNVYTHRFYDTDKILFEKFEEITGIKVNVKKDDADKLIALLQSEGENTEADVLITVDAGRLYYAKELGLLQSVESKSLDKNVPEHLRDPEKMWFGLTKRARVIIYNKDEVNSEELSTYENLVNEKWSGEIFVRSSSNIYNQSLLASIIANHGEESALEWAKGVVSNMSREPKGNDRDQMKEVAAGNGKIAIANSYYLGKLLNSENDMEKKAGEKLGIFFPNQETTGTHINVSGAGITKYSPNAENGILLLEFLTGDNAQKLLAESNYEYPVNPNIEPSELLKSWGDFKEDEMNLDLLGKYNAKAVELFELSGWK